MFSFIKSFLFNLIGYCELIFLMFKGYNSITKFQFMGMLFELCKSEIC